MDDQTRLSNSDDPTILSGTNDATMLSPLSGGSWAAWSGDGPKLEAGAVFGPYTIGRLLGRGGMGEVYEALQVETGRRVALKLLRGRIDQREDRARFLSEGRLAASISHPHTVYIFGSEEVDGMPVISMQLLPGGTLKDRVVERGPLSVPEAVSAIVDVIGGLDAAATAGILHRDIKPSNCFVDADGSVKVGDFGLSISTSARDGQGAGRGFQGTPQYAPPEQLRGEKLDVRADIYAVGATLFYLVTGKAPFEAQDFQTLIDQVKSAPAPLAHKVRPGIPKKLSAVIARTLAKDPADRPASYSDLVALLRPFSGETMPAPRGLRLIAGVIDLALLSVPSSFLQMATVRTVRGNTSTSIDASLWPIVIGVLYFGASEWLWGTTIGKRICGMRVASTTGDVTWRQAFARAFIYYAPRLPIALLVLAAGLTPVTDYLTAHVVVAACIGASPFVLTVALFATMRRTNGFAAVQDLATGTRVVQRKSRELRRGAAMGSESPVLIGVETGRRRFGVFEVVDAEGAATSGRAVEAIDTVLQRRVWIVECEAGAPDVSRARRDVDRVGRLHWLAGRRLADENWDAFEAPQGAPVDPTPGGSPWSSVRGWLNDLAAELAAAERDATLPELSLDRVWIRPDGRAVLLDIRSPENRDRELLKITPDPYFSPGRLLVEVARLGFGNAAAPMPVSAVAMLDRWARKPDALSIADARRDLDAIALSPDTVSRRRRLTPLVMTATPVVLTLIITAVALRTMRETLSPHTFQAIELLGDLDKEVDPARKAAIETYLAGTLRPQLTDDQTWKTMLAKDDDGEVARLRGLAANAMARQPTPDEIAKATAKIQFELDKADSKRSTRTTIETVFMALLLTGCGMTFVSGLVSVLVRPSGVVLSALGLAVLARSGREISRLRAVARLIVAWSPIIVYGALVAIPATRPFTSGMLAPSIAVALVAAGAAWTIARPTRGPHDIVMRTTIGVR